MKMKQTKINLIDGTKCPWINLRKVNIYTTIGLCILYLLFFLPLSLFIDFNFEGFPLATLLFLPFGLIAIYSYYYVIKYKFHMRVHFPLEKYFSRRGIKLNWMDRPLDINNASKHEKNFWNKSYEIKQKLEIQYDLQYLTTAKSTSAVVFEVPNTDIQIVFHNKENIRVVNGYYVVKYFGVELRKKAMKDDKKTLSEILQTIDLLLYRAFITNGKLDAHTQQ